MDTSAILAILFQEPDADYFLAAIGKADDCKMSAANAIESAIVIDNKGNVAASRQYDLFIEQARIRIEPVTALDVQIARQAYLDFGKGNHPAGLNFGDCFAYALAKRTREPLLFKGNGFSQTDILQFS